MPNPTLQIRCPESDKEYLERAAEASYLTLSAWCLQTLKREADRVLTEQKARRHGELVSRLIDGTATPSEREEAAYVGRELLRLADDNK